MNTAKKYRIIYNLPGRNLSKKGSLSEVTGIFSVYFSRFNYFRFYCSSVIIFLLSLSLSTFGQCPTKITADYCNIVDGKVLLTSTSATTYLWNTGETTRSIWVPVSGAGNYTVTATGCTPPNNSATINVGANIGDLVVNGNFNTASDDPLISGFYSSYGYTSSNLLPEGLYAITPNSNLLHSNFWGFDHTHHTGTTPNNYMAVNGNQVANITVWRENVSVETGITYYFSVWAMSVNDVSPFAELQLNINNAAVVTLPALPAGVRNINNPWRQYYIFWTSDVTGSIPISITDRQTIANGNDFGLDDITFSRLNPVSLTTPTAGSNSPVCPGGTINLTASLPGGGGTAPLTYSWQGPNGFTTTPSTDPNLSRPNATSAMDGPYTVTVTDFVGCSKTSAPITVSVTSGITLTAYAIPPGPICAGTPVNLSSSANPISTTLLSENFNGATNNWTRSGSPNWTLQNDGYRTDNRSFHSNDNSRFFLADKHYMSGTTSTYLQSPTVSTIGYTDLSLNFWHYYNDDDDSGSDVAKVEVSTDGTTWVTPPSSTFTNDIGTSTGFVNQTINLDSYINNAVFYVRFNYTSRSYARYWAIDNVTLSGHSANYQISWISNKGDIIPPVANPVVSPSVNTTYTVTYTNPTTGCSESKAVNVTVISTPAIPTITPGGPLTLCAGGSVTLSSSAGTTYLWSTGATTQSININTSGSYSVRITNAGGCQSVASAPVTVTVNPSPTTPTITAGGPLTFCAGGSVTLTSSAGTTYLWSNGATTQSINVTTSGSYTVRVTNSAGCQSAASAPTVVTVNPTPSTPAVNVDCSLGFGQGILTVTAPTPLTDYQFSLNGVQFGTTFTNVTNGSHSIVARNNTTGCTSQAAVVNVNCGCSNPPFLNLNSTNGNTGCSTEITVSGNTFGGNVNLTQVTASSPNGGGILNPTTFYSSPFIFSYTPVPADAGKTVAINFTTNNPGGGCSPATATYTLAVSPLSMAPAVTTPVVYCQNAMAVPLTSTGTGLLWYATATGGTGSATAPTPFTTAPGSTSYWVSQTEAGGCEGPRAEIVITVNPLPAAPTVTTPVNYCLNAEAVPLTATGTGLLWYTTSIGGTGSATAPMPSTAATGSTSYWVSQTNINSCESPRAQIVVTINPFPVITSQPVNHTICPNTNTFFTIVATGAANYQWEENSGAGWGPVGTNSPTLNLNNVYETYNGYQYRCNVISSANCSQLSNPATLSVTSAPTISVQPTDQSICEAAGEMGTFSVTAIGTGLSYQWQRSVDGTNWNSDPDGTNSPTLVKNYYAGIGGTQYRCIVTDNCGQPVTSDPATLLFKEKPVITLQPQNIHACAYVGRSKTFIINPLPNTSYKWQYRINSLDSWHDLSDVWGSEFGVSSSELRVWVTNTNKNGYQYRCILTSTTSLCSTTSEAATLTVDPTFTQWNLIPDNPRFCSGQNITLTTDIAHPGSYFYLWFRDGSPIDPPETGPSLNVSLAAAYSVRVTDPSTGCDFTRAATTVEVEIKPPVGGIVISSGQTEICKEPATPVHFSAELTPPFNYSWPSQLTYQWKKNGVNVGGNWPYYDDNSLFLNNGDKIICVLTANVECAPNNPATSNEITMTVNPSSPVSVSISANPGATICAGTSVTFTANPTNGGSNPAYQWKRNGNNEGTNGPTYTPSSLANGDQITCVLTSNINCPSGNPATSNKLTINVVEPSTYTVSLYPYPPLCPGRVYLDWSDPATTYFLYKDGLPTGYSFTGVDDEIILPGGPTSIAGTYTIRAELAGYPGCSKWMDGSAVIKNNPIITGQPSNQTVCLGGSVSFSVIAAGEGLSYQWRRGTMIIPGATSSIYTISPVGAGDARNDYNVVITNVCGSAISNYAALRVNTAPAISNQPANRQICAGTSTSFTVTATGADLTYQWEKYQGSLPFVPVSNDLVHSGATASTLTLTSPPSGMGGTVYRVVVSGSCSPSPATSWERTLTFFSPLVAGGLNDPTPVSACVNYDPPAIRINNPPVTTGSGPHIYQWYQDLNPVGINDNYYDPPKITSAGTYNFYCVITDQCGSVVTTAIKTITIVSVPTVTISGGGTLCQNALSPLLTATVNNGIGTITYQWQSSPTGIGSWTNIANATSSTYLPPTSTVGTIYYRVIVTTEGPEDCNSAASAAMAVKINLLPTTSLIYHQ